MSVTVNPKQRLVGTASVDPKQNIVGTVSTGTKPISAEVDSEVIRQAVSEYLNENPPAQGPAGPPGPKGDTPIKGVDYNTDADKEEIVAAVIAALPKYDGEVIME